LENLPAKEEGAAALFQQGREEKEPRREQLQFI
jgi:hypothetical protein